MIKKYLLLIIVQVLLLGSFVNLVIAPLPEGGRYCSSDADCSSGNVCCNGYCQECCSNDDYNSCGNGCGHYKCINGICSSSCTLDPGNECFPGDTRSCWLTITYNYCDAYKNCESKNEIFKCGKQTCRSDCKWDECQRTDSCLTNECNQDSECKNCITDLGGWSCMSNEEACEGYCGSGNMKWCLPSRDCAGCCCLCKTEVFCNDGEDEDADGLVDCADPDCARKTLPDGTVCCQSDDDCAHFDCSQQGYPNRIAECDLSTHTCRCDPCQKPEHCEDGYCCLVSEGKCKPAGYITSDGKYLCDPPYGFVSSIQKDNSSTLFDYLLNLLHRFRFFH